MRQVMMFRWLTLAGYFGLMALLFIWPLFIQPIAAEFISITLTMQLGPLMFPLRGLLHGKIYTHSWASYLALFYFVVGVWYAAATDTRVFGILVCMFSLDFFIGAVFYSRYAARHNAKQAAADAAAKNKTPGNA
jgi:uncharacterized membrane protein